MASGKSHLFRPVALAAAATLAILASCCYAANRLPQLWCGNFVSRDMEVPMPLYLRWAFAAPVPDLPKFAAHGAVFHLRRDREAARTMKLTARCIDFLKLLRGARWLFTSQVHRRFFPHATLDAARKFLRKLLAAHYVTAYRAHRMAETLYTLGPEGKRVLERTGAGEIRLERKPPKQIEHFSAVNDLRIAAELAGSLAYFFAYWELPALGWRHAIIPDATCAFAGRTYAIEFDRGLEGVKFFLRTKIAAYERGLTGFPMSALIIVADRRARLETLARAIANGRQPVFFTTLDQIRTQGFAAPIFYRHANDAGSRLS